MITKLVSITGMLVLVLFILLPATADDAEAGIACWVYRNLGYHPLAWDLCMLEIWNASGHPEVPDPGEGSGGDW